MSEPSSPSSDIAFTTSVKAVQAAKGSRRAYEKLEARGGFHTAIDAGLAGYLAQAESAYFATASGDGRPYVQHRGGPRGFIRVVDAHTLAFADYAGNRQYISVGNLAENDRAFLFVMDYVNRQRVKIWGRAHVSEDADLIAELMPEDYKARPERAIVFTVEAWDGNCHQHIPQKIDAADVAAAIEPLQARIDELEAENARLRGAAP